VLIGDGGTVQPMDFDLVLCGPSRLRAWSGRLADLEDRPASVAVIVNPADVDFTALLAAGIAVLWDYRGGTSSFTAAVQAALAGQAWVSESLTAAMAAGVGEQLRRDLRAADFGLTLREGEILQLLATGASNREIAARLFISQNTVKNHVRSVLEKLHAASRTEAVMIGARAGVIDVRAGRP
jgi:two-component system NarL family response regulator